jgi:ABC-2 type transport system ATP-binding protein
MRAPQAHRAMAQAIAGGDAIAFRNVVKKYGAFAALDGFELTVPEGALYGLLGPNGAGKTTAIRILIGLQQATSGDVTVLGRSPTDVSLRPEIGYMPQETALYLDLTVRENLDLFGRLYGLTREQRATRTADLLEFVDLKDWADEVITKLSGGMKHRTSLAAALLPKPRLLVLDEPTVGVDPELRAQFWERFAGMQKEGTTILLTTHYMDEARRCERVGFVRRGKLIKEGAPDAILRETGTQHLEDAFLKLGGRGEA